MTFDVIELLTDEALNEQEKYKIFRKRLEEFCTGEMKVFSIFRILGELQNDLERCLNDEEQVNVNKSTVERLLCAISVELQIIRYRIRHPELDEVRFLGKIGEWTGAKADLIELIYAISLARSVENGKVSVKAIKEGFEFIFGIDLGNIHDRIEDIAGRKGTRTKFLEKLVESLNKFLESMDAR
jgi:hypothetical protein